MSTSLHRPEILAPAGTDEAFASALASGADAVYLGLWERAEEVTRTLGAYHKLLAGELSPEEVLKVASVHERYGVTTPLRIHKR